MAYTTINFKTKKVLREAVVRGDIVTYYQPNADLTGASPPSDGTVYLEGPHYPAQHTWYAVALVREGRVIKVK